MQKNIFAHFLIGSLLASNGLAAGLDELSKAGPKATPAPKSVPTTQAPAPTPSAPVGVPKPNKLPPPKVPGPVEPTDRVEESQKEEALPEAKSPKEAGETKPASKPVDRSAASKALDKRLSLGTSLGWSIIKPAKGTWTGIGSSDVSFRWRTSPKENEKLYITGRYVPFTGVWTVDRRDYDSTLHGIYAGAEYGTPAGSINGPSLKAGVELGYLMVYAKAQDEAVESNDVKGGKVNLSIGGGADWGFVSDKLKVGPFLRAHVLGFTIFHLGVSAQFVF